MSAMRNLSLGLILAALLLAAPSLAAPIVSLDLDPGTSGVQSDVSLTLGAPLLVDVVIEGADAPGLQGFELDVLFDASVVTAVSVVDGGFLLDPVFVIQNDIGVFRIEFAEITLLPFGATGSGVLATLAFNTTGLGTSDLDLTNLKMSAPFGVAILPDAVNDGIVTVTNDSVSPPIPEPSGALTFIAGLAIFGLARPQRRG